ncbi:hypothetical protein SR914_18185 [Comamonas testosteroni]|uniref:hypothetical protein n=1 Tax=Comamonas testosteroni TaxID=285 RepID=UPI000305284E|nr:hypothetical protein [Comamonas testosteroni]WQG65124.1 hypothetical protein SR914_18185 [Comamonas testosteroni]
MAHGKHWLVWIVGRHDALSARIYWAERIAPILLFCCLARLHLRHEERWTVRMGVDLGLSFFESPT